MANKDARSRYQNARDRLDRYCREGKIADEDADAIRSLCDAFDVESAHVSVPTRRDLYEYPDRHQKVEPREPNTLSSWINELVPLAKLLKLTEADADEINSLTTRLIKGQIEGVQEYEASTIQSRENSMRIFYRYHDDLRVDPREVYVHDSNPGEQGSNWDRRDILDKEEIQKMSENAGHPRNLAIFHLLLYTGVRNTAARTLRLKDIDLDEGTFWFNRKVDGTKNIHRIDEPRPLLLAVDAVREWLRYHPSWNGPNDYEPDHYLFTAHPRYANPDPTEPVSAETIRKAMASITRRTEEAGYPINKPAHPHMMRHNFVTRCKLNYDMGDDTIKFLLGHGPESKVMETTYSHLSGEDHVDTAKEAFGVAEPEEEDSPFTPEACPTCSRVPRPDARQCDRCGEIFAPDAFMTQQALDDAIYEGKGQAETEAEHQGLDLIRDIVRNDSEVKAALIDEMKDEIVAEVKEDLR